jgi:hypothetical protein
MDTKDSTDTINKIMLMMKALLERADINHRIAYNKLEWTPLTKVWNECHRLKPYIACVDDLFNFVKPILLVGPLEVPYLESTLQCSVALAAKLTTTWETILEPSCSPGKSTGTRTKGFCDLLIITSPFRAFLFEFKRFDMVAAKEEVTGYMVIQNTKTLKILNDGREEDFWSDQLSFDRYAVTGENGLTWTPTDPDLVKIKMEKMKTILFPRLESSNRI